MLKISIAILLLSFIFSTCTQAASDTILFKENGSLIIKKTNLFYYVNIYGEIILTDKFLSFHPRTNKQYVLDLQIPLDSIDRITNKYYTRILFKTKNGNQYMILLKGRRKRLEQKMDSVAKIEHAKIKKNNLRNVTEKCMTKNNEVKIWMACLGSTFYSPFTVRGCIEKRGESIIFTPTEYTCYIKTIGINRYEIKKVKKRLGRKVIVELNSGVKYRFITHNKKQFINDFISK